MLRASIGLCCALFGLGIFWHVPASAQGTTPLGPLHTLGAQLVDAQGHEVRITGVNWFGLETETYAPHGLWTRNYAEMLDQIAAAGFNTLRLPYTNQLFDPASTPRSIDFAKNADLQGLSGLQVMDRLVAAAGQRGLSVLLDRHRPTASRQSELWYTPEVPESRWLRDWVILAQHYAGNPTVIGADLHNEPHGPATWGDGNLATDWRLAAERAGNAILDVNPDWLIVVEGIEHYGNNDWYWWGGNLAGARDAPVRLSVPGRLVYSTHDYGPGVYRQAWFGAVDFPANLPRLWHDHWAFLQQDGIAPVLVGEFGGRSVGSDAEGIWQRSLVGYLRDNNLSYTYWAWNPDSGDTGGILADDWSTLDQRKLTMLAAYQWPLEGRGQQPTAAMETPTAPTLARPPLIASDAPRWQVVRQAGSAVPANVFVLRETGTGFAAGGPFDPDIQHALQGIGGPNDPDGVHREAREQDERRYLAEFGKPWQYAAYATGA
jgi:endoglucanase